MESRADILVCYFPYNNYATIVSVAEYFYKYAAIVSAAEFLKVLI